MRYPQAWRKFVNATAVFSGGLAFLIGCFAVMEAILRYFFSSPTKWSLNVSEYLLVYMLFIGSAYAFQEQGHVAVDMVRNLADKVGNKDRRILRRTLAVLGYVMALVYIALLLYGTWELLQQAIKYNRMTIYLPVIPIWLLYLPMLVGMVMMFVTLVFMILDCMSKSDTYI